MQATVVICSAKMARKLLKDGYSIVDIKPDKTDLEGKPDRSGRNRQVKECYRRTKNTDLSRKRTSGIKSP